MTPLWSCAKNFFLHPSRTLISYPEIPGQGENPDQWKNPVYYVKVYAPESVIHIHFHRKRFRKNV